MTTVLFVVLALLAGALLFANGRRRAARDEAAAAIERARQAQRKRAVPEVSNNLKGVTATQTMQPYRAATSGNKSSSGEGDLKAG